MGPTCEFENFSRVELRIGILTLADLRIASFSQSGRPENRDIDFDQSESQDFELGGSANLDTQFRWPDLKSKSGSA